MKNKVTIIEKQSLLDIAIQTGGSLDTLFELADTNGLDITDSLEAGKTYTVTQIDNQDYTTYYAHRNIHPVSEYADLGFAFPEGIEFWYLEEDFVVS